MLRLAAEVGASSVHVADDVSGFAQRRLERLTREAGRSVAVERHPGVTVVRPGALSPGGGEFKVFTPTTIAGWPSAGASPWRRHAASRCRLA